ncbi:hypothetical protein [Nostoc sp.]|uniref:hypothetical protein n=1 Tax=Nostoc sp. TaxID=1180 RepID=UPI002FF7F7B5
MLDGLGLRSQLFDKGHGALGIGHWALGIGQNSSEFRVLSKEVRFPTPNIMSA